MVGALPLDMVMSHHVLAKVLDENTMLSNGLTTGQMYVKEKDMGKHHLSVDELRKLPLALAGMYCCVKPQRLRGSDYRYGREWGSCAGSSAARCSFRQ